MSDNFWFFSKLPTFEPVEIDEQEEDNEFFDGSSIFNLLNNSYIDIDEQKMNDLQNMLIWSFKDTKFKENRHFKMLPKTLLRVEEFCLIRNVVNIFDSKPVPKLVGDILLTIFGRTEFPPNQYSEFLPKDAIPFDNVRDATLPYDQTNYTPTLLIRTVTDTIALPKISFEVMSADKTDKEGALTEDRLVRDSDIFSLLKFGKANEFPLSFYTTLKNQGKIRKVPCGKNDFWYSFETKNFKMAFGNDISGGKDKRRIVPWVNNINNECPPTLDSFDKKKTVEWISSMNDLVIETEYASQCCPIYNPDGYREAFHHHFVQANDLPKFNMQFIKGDQTKSTVDSDPDAENTIYCLWCDPETGLVPKSSLWSKDDTVVVQCNELCPCHGKCKCCPLASQKLPKISLMYFESKHWGVVAEEDIEEGQFITEYTGNRIENVSGTESAYLFDLDFSFTSNNYQIDAKNLSNASRFFNHSCEFANATALKIVSTLANSLRIGYFASRKIFKGEEITICYGASFKINPCACNYCLANKLLESEQQ